ncbi:MAG TPA: hypothetical protein VKF36_08595 [Syntrophorhabdales bacterium]|nr:hypothetical protein [Syntrophorhabdales bacterium]
MKKTSPHLAVDPKAKRFTAPQESEALVNDLLAYCDERKRQHKLRLREWKARHRAYEQGKGEDPGSKPLPFTIIKDVRDLEMIIKLELLLLGEGTDTKKARREKKRR